MIEIFKTDVSRETQAKALLKELRTQLPESQINFDLEDYDKILRVEGASFTTDAIMLILTRNGFNCRILD